MVKRKQIDVFFVLGCEPEQEYFMKVIKLVSKIELSFFFWMCWNLIKMFKKFPMFCHSKNQWFAMSCSTFGYVKWDV
jgi:hypothetical protein